MLKNGVRELAYIVKIDEVKPIEGRDRVECAVVGGWTCMVPVDSFKPGDLGVYFEIDSRLPEKEPFLFLEKRHYKIKTQKFKTPTGQFWSQGLLMPIYDFDETSFKLDNPSEGDCLTEFFGVTYADAEDNSRKAKSADKYKLMAQRRPNIFKQKWAKWLMRRKWGRKLMFLFFGHKKDAKREWPSWVRKTDEERVQNLGAVYESYRNQKWIATEKLDGTSSTFTLKKNKKGLKTTYDFLVCSRNVVFATPDKKCFYDTNVYLEAAEKYNIESALRKIMDELGVEWITLQGEIYGAGIQKRDYGLSDHQFAGFNLITSDKGRWNSVEAKEKMTQYDIPWVPILDTKFELPETIAELLDIATDKSTIDGGMREGLVFRSEDGILSFKAVSNSFLDKYHR